LPNVLLGSWLQREMYNEGKGPAPSELYNKVLFVVIMALITVASFSVRLWLVYFEGYATVVDNLMRTDFFTLNMRVVLAVVIPPIIDGVQSTALIMTGSHAQPLLPQLVKGQQKMRKEVAEMHVMLKSQQEKVDMMHEILRRANPEIAASIENANPQEAMRAQKPSNEGMFDSCSIQ